MANGEREQDTARRATVYTIDALQITEHVLKFAIPAAAGVAGVGIRYAYERGFASYFGVPIELIRLETTDIAVSAFCLGCEVIIALKILALYSEVLGKSAGEKAAKEEALVRVSLWAMLGVPIAVRC